MKGEKDGLKDIERATKLDPNSALPHLKPRDLLFTVEEQERLGARRGCIQEGNSAELSNLEFQNTAAEKMLAEVQKRKK